MKPTVKWGIVFLVGFAVMLLAGAGLRDLWDPDEPRYAQVAREMSQTGNWAVPHLNGEVYTDKPPMLFWLIAGASKIFFGGEVNAMAARLPSALAALFSLVLIWRLGSRWFGESAGLLAMIILATTYRFWMQAIWCQMEMLLAFFILASLALFWRAYNKVEEGLWGSPTRGRPAGAGTQRLNAAGSRRHPPHGGYPACDFRQKIDKLAPGGDSHNPSSTLFVWSLFYLSLALGFLTKGPVAILIPCGIIFFFLLWERRLGFLLKMWIPMGIVILLLVDGGWIWAAYKTAGASYLQDHFIHHNFTRYVDPWGHRYPFYYYFLNFPLDALPWILFLPAALAKSWRETPSVKTSPRRFLFVWFALIFIFYSFSESKRNLYLTPLFPTVALFLGEFFSLAASARVRKIFWRTAAGTFVLSFAALCLAFPFANRFKSARPFAKTVKKQIGSDGKLAYFQDLHEGVLFYLGSKPGLPVLSSETDLDVYLRRGPKQYLLIKERDLKKVHEQIQVEISEEQKVGHRHLYLVHLKD